MAYAHIPAQPSQDPALGTFKQRFSELFPAASGRDPLVSFAPGRINFISEHTDYIGGQVLPASIDRGVFALGSVLASAAEATATTTVVDVACHDGAERCSFLVARNVEEGASFATLSVSAVIPQQPQKPAGSNVGGAAASPPPATYRWANYIKALIGQLRVPSPQQSASSHVAVLIASTLPVGAGLSSSAALCCATINLLLALFGAPAAAADDGDGARRAIVLAAQASEHAAGTLCGVMDQSASMWGRKDEALLLDCAVVSDRSADPAKAVARRIPLAALRAANVHIILVDSLVTHELGDAYNQIRRSMFSAQDALASAAAAAAQQEGGAADAPFRAVTWATARLRDMLAAQQQQQQQTPLTAVEMSRAIGAELTALAQQRAVSDAGAVAKLAYIAAETARTLLFCDLLERLQRGVPPSQLEYILGQLGELLNETHAGLRDTLGVSTAELDFLQEILAKGRAPAAHREEAGNNDDDAEQAGGAAAVAAAPSAPALPHSDVGCKVLGARMMGGGGGGCVLALVRVLPPKPETIGSAISTINDPLSLLMQRVGDAFGCAFFPGDVAFRARWYNVNVGPGASLVC